MTSWNTFTMAAGDLERARRRLHTVRAALNPSVSDVLDGVICHLDDVIADVAAMITRVVEIPRETLLDRERHDREVAEDLRGDER